MAAESIADVLTECRELICKAGTERTRRLLRRELASLEDEHRTALSADTSKAHPMIRVPAAGDNRITSYAWDQTPKFVKCVARGRLARACTPTHRMRASLTAPPDAAVCVRARLCAHAGCM